MTRFPLIIALAFSFAAAGCTAYQPDPIKHDEMLRALRQTGPLLNARVIRERLGEGSSIEFDLTDGFSESEVVAIALELNPDLKSKRMEIDEQRPLTIAAGLWPKPELGLSVRPGLNGTFGPAIDADFLVELLRPQVREARKKSAEARVAQTVAEVYAAELELARGVRSKLLAVSVAQQSMQLEQSLFERREQLLTLARERRRVGEGTTLDISTAELELAQARRRLRSAQAEQAVTRQELNRLIGLPPDYMLVLEADGKPITFVLFDDISDDEIDRRLVAGRPELKAALAAHDQAEQELRLAILGQYPKIRLGPAYGRELEGDNTLGLSAGLELPIFNQNQAAIESARVQRDRRKAEYQSALQRLRADAFHARAALRLTRDQLNAEESELLPLVQRNQQLYQSAFRSGELSIFNAIAAEERAIEARRDHLDTLRRYHDARIQFENATGLLLSRPIPTTNPTTRPS